MSQFVAAGTSGVESEQHFWERRLFEECTLSDRYNQSFALVLLTLDAPGKDGGYVPIPEALDLVAGSLRTGVRATDVVVRVGPARFGILLLDTNPEFTAAVADRLVDKVRTDVGALRLGLQAGRMSYGVAVCGAQRPPPATLVATAEADLRRRLGAEDAALTS